ncbi:MAG: hypothetical protein A2007_03395 [Verrucomicrobia bacterium GWC2_42_7]|nr:MAG: hypothetical protein A2007_03395 [Verrucomicrobia bacterium GWC2_42_7]
MCNWGKPISEKEFVKECENLSFPEKKGFRAFQRKATVAEVKSFRFFFREKWSSLFNLDADIPKQCLHKKRRKLLFRRGQKNVSSFFREGGQGEHEGAYIRT